MDYLNLKNNDKVGIVVAHPDDEVLMYELINYLVDRKIKTTVILLTRGELGGDEKIRKREFFAAMGYWGFEYELFRFPDLGLIYLPLKKMVEAVRKVVVERKITLLVSFWPNEITYGFDHPDHNRAGEVTRVVSASILGNRPKLYFWTSMGKSNQTKKKIEYLKRFYPSQYKEEYDCMLNIIGENYLKVR